MNNLNNNTKQEKQKEKVNKKKSKLARDTENGKPVKGKNIVLSRNLATANRLQMSSVVPECVTHYAHGLIDPWGAEPGICVPAELFPISTNKMKVLVPGTLQLGTTGVGFIVCRACVAADAAFAITTTATSVGTETTPFNGFTNLATHMPTQLLYVTADFVPVTESTMSSRCAALGVRVKYIDKLMDMNGICVGMEHPDHVSLLTTGTYDILNKSQYSVRKRVGPEKEWDCEISYSGPTAPNDADLVGGTVTPLGPGQFMCIAIKGEPGDLYAFEVVEHVELAGTKVLSRTKSHAEPEKFAKVAEVAKEMSTSKPLTPQEAPSFWQKLGDKFISLLPDITGGIIGAAKTLSGDISGIPMLAGIGSKLLLQGPQLVSGVAGQNYPRLTAHQMVGLSKHPLLKDR